MVQSILYNNNAIIQDNEILAQYEISLIKQVYAEQPIIRLLYGTAGRV